jgi:hypothetical protein
MSQITRDRLEEIMDKLEGCSESSVEGRTDAAKIIKDLKPSELMWLQFGRSIQGADDTDDLKQRRSELVKRFKKVNDAATGLVALKQAKSGGKRRKSRKGRKSRKSRTRRRF